MLDENTMDLIMNDQILTAAELNQIAKDARETQDYTGPKQTKFKIDVLEVDTIVAEIVEYMIAAAFEGAMEFEYDFKEKPKELMKAVALAVREMYPQNLMIIKHEGRNVLQLDWCGKNEV